MWKRIRILTECVGGNQKPKLVSASFFVVCEISPLFCGNQKPKLVFASFFCVRNFTALLLSPPRHHFFCFFSLFFFFCGLFRTPSMSRRSTSFESSRSLEQAFVRQEFIKELPLLRVRTWYDTALVRKYKTRLYLVSVYQMSLRLRTLFGRRRVLEGREGDLWTIFFLLSKMTLPHYVRVTPSCFSPKITWRRQFFSLGLKCYVIVDWWPVGLIIDSIVMAHDWFGIDCWWMLIRSDGY